jgi:hypothetical protein
LERGSESIFEISWKLYYYKIYFRNTYNLYNIIIIINMRIVVRNLNFREEKGERKESN